MSDSNLDAISKKKKENMVNILKQFQAETKERVEEIKDDIKKQLNINEMEDTDDIKSGMIKTQSMMFTEKIKALND